MPLVLKLRAGETLLINGARIKARGETEVILMNDARFLCGSQVMHAFQATTSLRKLYLHLQDAYVGLDDVREPSRRAAQSQLDAARAGLPASALVSLAEAMIAFDAGRFHDAMRTIRHLVHESEARTERVPA